MIRLLLFTVLTLGSAAASAQSVYRCTVDGRTVFQDRPCHGSSIDDNVIDATPRTSGLGGISAGTQNLAAQAKNRKLIAERKVREGMSADQVRQSWGAPTNINRSSDGREQWVYQRGPGRAQYVYMQDGQVASWQSND